jgi:hypothetical protein
MNIGQAVQALREGARVARAGWNGKGMWVALRMPQDSAETEPYVYLSTSEHTYPWNCSQADLMADDWTIVE